MDLLCDFAWVILVKETGKLLEYWHLIWHPKYRQTRKQAYRNEIGCLAQGTNTLLFVNKSDIPQDRHKDVCTVGSYVTFKKIKPSQIRGLTG